MFKSPAFIGGISWLIYKIICAQQAQADEKAQSRRRRDEPYKEVCNAAIGH